MLDSKENGFWNGDVDGAQKVHHRVIIFVNLPIRGFDAYMIKLKDLMDHLSLFISKEMPNRKVIHTEMLTHESDDSGCISLLECRPNFLPHGRE